MIFEVNKTCKKITGCRSYWDVKELELEKYILSTAEEEEAAILNSSVFRETLLFINHQVKIKAGKIADIVALDRMGNSVIIELKRRKGSLGVETQALQYLAGFSKYKGQNFINHFSKGNPSLEENIRGFLGDEVRTEDINKNSRIILMARSFDSTLFSMGEWLSSKGVAFRCIEYTPIELEGKRFLSFSVAFDRSPESIFPIDFRPVIRPPAYYWHNVGMKGNNDWWSYLVKTGQIATSFECQPGDQGENILKNYIKGDTIIAYVKEYGAAGWGIIKNPDSYKLLNPGDKDDFLNGVHLHRLNIDWQCTVDKIEDALRPAELLKKYGIFHPMSTSVRIDPNKAKQLLKDMPYNANKSEKH